LIRAVQTQGDSGGKVSILGCDRVSKRKSSYEHTSNSECLPS